MDRLKSQLAYEIQLVLNLGIKQQLRLMFDMAEIQSKLLKLTQVYAANLKRRADPEGQALTEDFVPDAAPYFEGIKPILLFFCSVDCMDTFAENNSKLIEEVLKNPTVSNSEDFIIFLHAVVRADLANESEVEGESDGARRRRVQKARYGTVTNINKFSMTHIEWLSDAMPQLAGMI